MSCPKIMTVKTCNLIFQRVSSQCLALTMLYFNVLTFCIVSNLVSLEVCCFKKVSCRYLTGA